MKKFQKVMRFKAGDKVYWKFGGLMTIVKVACGADGETGDYFIREVTGRQTWVAESHLSRKPEKAKSVADRQHQVHYRLFNNQEFIFSRN